MNSSIAIKGAKAEASQTAQSRIAQDSPSVVRRHLRFGWWSLLVFLTLGLALEVLHGFKVGAYLNLSNETRRLMWTLAHAHGTLLALVHIGFAFSVRQASHWPVQRRAVASAAMVGAGLFMPMGFFLGGLFVYGGDPGVGILLVPLGGAMLFVAVLSTARAMRYSVDAAEDPAKKARR